MKKSYKLENLDCAHCAAKMETAIGKLPGVKSANISFMAQRLNIEADDLEETVAAAQKEISKIEKNCKIKL